MCINPVKVPNVSLGNSYTCEAGFIKRTNPRLVSAKPYIEVPCGKCVECRNKLYSSYLQRVQMESLTSYVYMITLTYDDRHLPSLVLNTDKGNMCLYYTDFKHIQDMFKRLRKCSLFQERSFSYMVVTEYGTTGYRPHIHMLLFVSRLSSDIKETPKFLEPQLYKLIRNEWRVNVGSRRSPLYEPLFTYRERLYNGKLHRNFDLHLVSDDFGEDSLAISSACKYLVGYLLKPCGFERKMLSVVERTRDYLPADIWRQFYNIVRCRVRTSKHFGFGFDSLGRRVRPSIHYQRSCNLTAELSLILGSLPDSEDDFFNAYGISIDCCISNIENRLLLKSSLIDCVRSFDSLHKLYFCAIYRYRRNYFQSLMHRHIYETESLYVPIFSISFDDTYKSSKTYKFLRRYVEQSLHMKLPFFSFFYDGKCVPMCTYFKKYVCMEVDFLKLLDNLGVSTVDEIIFDDRRRKEFLYSYFASQSSELFNTKQSQFYRKSDKFSIKSNKILADYDLFTSFVPKMF